jgi:hypothetical protein
MANDVNIKAFTIATLKNDAVLTGQKLTVSRKVELFQLAYERPFIWPLHQGCHFIADLLRHLSGVVR